MMAVAPMSTALFASAMLMMPLRQNCLPHFLRTSAASCQFIDWLSKYRNVRTLFHVVLQLGQLELLMHEIVGRPPRVHGEADEAFERQARGRGEAGPQVAFPVSARDRIDG